MRALLISVAVPALFVASQLAVAQSYPYGYRWCAHEMDDGIRNCGFQTYDQCMAAILQSFGFGARCLENPRYRGSQMPNRRQELAH
jgi:hypothetical protein